MHTNITHHFTQDFRRFARQHDDLPAFHAAFLVSTFLAAAILNLGCFAVLILLHVCLDIVKYHDVHGLSRMKTVYAAFLESLFDITLFFIAFASSVYLHHTFALASLSGLRRAGLSLFEIITTVVPKMQILQHFLYLLAGFHSYLHMIHPTIGKPMNTAQKVCLLAIVFCIGLLLFSPYRFAGQEDELMKIFARELVPGFM